MKPLFRLLVRYVIDFARANVTIAIQVLSPKIDLKVATVQRETRAKKPLEILALSNLVTFTPGSLLIDIEPGEKMTLHLLATDPESAADSIVEHLEKPLLEVTRK